jgi:hypothetical protein
MAQSSQANSNIAAGVLASLCVFYIFAPAGVFITALVISVFVVSIWAWFSFSLDDRKRR